MSHTHDDAVVIPLLRKHVAATLGAPPPQTGDGKSYFCAEQIDLDDYDFILIGISGGKDSIACLLRLLEMGADTSKIELWHHDVDGREGSTLMDWPFMVDYNRQLAQSFNLPLYFSWLEHGFEGEMLKQDGYSHPHVVETPSGAIKLPRNTERSKPGTRRRFPQVSANLQTRWCSSSLKIDVGRRALNNQERFDKARILFVTGERREESPNRARYNQLEAHACNRKTRKVDAWRPVLEWSEEQVWDALRRHGVVPPVPYRLGWSRSSCMTCIFNSPRIWATIARYFPERARAIEHYERLFDTTISRSRMTVLEQAAIARPFDIEDAEAYAQALASTYELPVITAPSDWRLPAGAFSAEGCGST